MYDRFVKDPSSVDEAWQQLFKDRQAAGSNGQPSQPAAKAATSPPAKSAEKAPAKQRTRHRRRRPTKHRAPASTSAKPQAAAPSKPGPAPEPAAKSPSPSPAATTGSAAASAAAPKGTASDTAAPAAQPATAAAVAKPVPKEPTKDDTADALQKPEHVILRGAAARTVSNMDSSLAVPTATSVRTVPVKLLIDNRIVINNHLARARGGKVSFTHIIGFALVKALRADAGDELRLRGGRRQAQPGQAAPHQPRPRDRHAEAGRHPAAAGAVDQGRRATGRSRSSGRRTRTSSGVPATTSSRSRTSRAPRSASPTRARSAPTTRCRG